jgi:TolB-like protein
MVAVTALQARGVAESDAAVFTETLADVLLRSGKVRVMERSQMDKILAEQGFQQAGACDTAECAVQMGRLLGIERIVVGSVGKVGETYSLSVRMVDVGTGEVLSSSRRNHRGAIDDVLDRVVPEVGRELIGSRDTRSGTSGGPAPQVEGERPSKAWLWWTLGGVAVAGGAATAVLLMGGSDDPASPTPDPSTDTTVPVRITLP